MQEIHDVFTYYGATRSIGKVKPLPATLDKIALLSKIPEIFNNAVAQSGRTGYRSKGSFGQINFTPAQCPWVAVFNEKITKTATNGYYIVLLFSADLSSCWLSLNQGYTAFKEQYVSDSLAGQKLAIVAGRAGSYIEDPNGVYKGPIELSTTSNLAKGYERGAIASFKYEANALPTLDRFERDLLILLEMYDQLYQKFGGSLWSLAQVTDSDFQDDINDLATNIQQVSPEESGAEQPPPLLPGTLGKRYARSGKRSAEALIEAGFACEVDSSHKTFISARSKHAYVEGHHLIPMSAQQSFLQNLDVRANIVALCPICHRLLHHGVVEAKKPLLTKLLLTRNKKLASKGIVISAEKLMMLYKKPIPELDG